MKDPTLCAQCRIGDHHNHNEDGCSNDNNFNSDCACPVEYSSWKAFMEQIRAVPPPDTPVVAARSAAEEIALCYIRPGVLSEDSWDRAVDPIAAIITRHFAATPNEDSKTMGQFYTEASAVVDRLSTELSELRADINLMRPVVNAAVAYTVEFSTGMTDEALLRLSVAVNAYRAAATTAPDETAVGGEAEDVESLHLAICQAVHIMNQGDLHAGHDLLRQTLIDFADKKAPLTRSEIVRQQQRSGSGKVTAVMVSRTEPPAPIPAAGDDEEEPQ